MTNVIDNATNVIPLDDTREKLRRLLDERSVHWWEGEDERKTHWVANGLTWEYFNDENDDAWLGFLGACEQDITPEQAVAATLGIGTCKNKATNLRTFWCDRCDCALEDWMDVGGKLVNGLRYCPNCGAKVVD